MKIFINLTLLLAATLLVSGCEFHKMKPARDEGLSAGQASQVSYQMVKKRVFTQYCITCHGNSGGISLDSYGSVKQNIAAIETVALITHTMPKNGSLPQSEQDLLASWIKAGAPEQPVPVGVGAPQSLKPTFVSIKRTIFDTRCLSCHAPGQSASAVPLTSLKDLLDSPRGLLSPGNSEASSLYTSLIRTDSQKMPPSPGAVSQEEISVIEKWINIGAPEGDEGLSRPIPPSLLSYQFVRASVFEPRCLSCHGNGSALGGVSLESYESVKQYTFTISQVALLERRMPPTSPLSGTESDILAAWILAGAPLHAGDAPTGNVPPGRPDVTKISYAYLKERVFVPRCLGCHGTSGGVNLETYVQVKENLGKITVAALIDKTMPKGGPLSNDEADLLKAWIKAGAPEGPVPPADSLKPTFTSLKKNIFEPKCLTCHSGAVPKGDVSFETLQKLKSSPRQPLSMEDAGDPMSSGLYLILTHADPKRRMPPAGSGNPLKPEEIEVIKQWIKLGAPADEGTPTPSPAPVPSRSPPPAPAPSPSPLPSRNPAPLPSGVPVPIPSVGEELARP
ncbi:MAG: hypothetical protein H7222_00565 [Methylotenera sp.]|nr:hypothetical protein [Oligoflexia bacterium]